MKWLIPAKAIKIVIDKEYVIENNPVNMSLFAVVTKGEFSGIDISKMEQNNVTHQGVGNKAQGVQNANSIIGSSNPAIHFCTLVDGQAVVAYQWVFEGVHERDAEYDSVIKAITKN